MERYIAILHPLKARHLITNKRLKIVQAVIWLISLVYNIPFLIFYDTISFSEHDKEFCYSAFEHMEILKWLSLINVIIWYIIPLLVVGCMYYRVARALWKTTVVAALRLRPYPDIEDASEHRNSTRITNTKCDSSHNAPYQNNHGLGSPMVSLDKSDKSDKSQPGTSSSEESQYSDKAIFTFKGKSAFTFVCGLRQGDDISPQEIKCFCPATQMPYCNESDAAIRVYNAKDSGTLRSFMTRSSFRQSRYRQTYLSSSRRVAKARKKVIRLLISIVITFAVCVLPHMMRVLNHYWMVFKLPHSVDTILSPVSFIILYLNSVLNPFLYAMFSTNFRRSFKETLPCFRTRRKSCQAVR